MKTKKPCAHCPYRHDIKPFLTPERGEELAYYTQNPYNTFPCHKTTVSDEEFGGDGTEMVEVETSLQCAGFITLQINEDVISCPKDFTPSDKVYSCIWDMVDAYKYQGK